MPKVISKTSIALAIAAAAAIAGASVGLGGGGVQDAEPVGGAPGPAHAPEQSEQSRQRYIVVYREAPLGAYKGDVQGLPAPRRLRANDAQVAAGMGVGRIDLASASSRGYLHYLDRAQQAHESRIGTAIGRKLRIEHRMRHGLNAVVAEMSVAEAARVSQLAEVRFVEAYREYPQATDTGPGLIGAPALWNATPSAYRGEGVVIGILDSGINFGSPSFAAVDASGYRHVNPLGAGRYLGTCAPGGVDEGRCNDKLIGGWDFVCGDPGETCGDADKREEPGFGDTNSHGSHVASTAAGNPVTAAFRGRQIAMSGVAPRANLIAYDVCYTRLSDGRGSCPNVSAARAIDQAIADGVVDVLNYSVGGGESPWGESVSQSFLNAVEAGIYVAASAGNSGPGPNTSGHLEPWVATTAMTQHGRGDIQPLLQVSGPGAVPEALQNVPLDEGINGTPFLAALPADLPLRISAGIDTANDGCAPFAADAFRGAIAVIRRGGCNFSIKINHATDAGASAVVIANNQADPGLNFQSTRVPAFMASQADSDALRDFANANGNAVVASFASLPLPNTPDQLSASSSRGPGGLLDQIKPDLAAPGVDILAVIAGTQVAGAEQWVGLMSGTSMASPHNAGAAALVRQARPEWTPSEIKSALMMTAAQTVLLEDGRTAAGPHATGAGRIQIDQAIRAGLLLDETAANYRAADPAAGGDVSALNLPSLGKAKCYNSCTFTRTFRNATAQSQTWNAKIEGGLNAMVTPALFTLAPGASRAVKVTVITTGQPENQWSYGKLVLTAQGRGSEQPVLRLPIAVSTHPASFRLNPEQVALSLPVGGNGSIGFRIQNTGGSALDYQIDNTGAGSRLLVANPVTSTGRGSASSFYASPAPGSGRFVSDDFVLDGLTSILHLQAEGFMAGSGDLEDSTQTVTVAVYADSDGMPAGNPLSAGVAPLWRYDAAVGSAGLSLDDDTVTLDLAAAGQALELPAGRYWLVVAPRVASQADRWVWFFSDQGTGGYRTIQTTDQGVGRWSVQEGSPGMAFSLRASNACGARWIGAPTRAFGRVLPAASTMAQVQINAGGLAPGQHVGYVCVAGNDPAVPRQALRVVLTVTP